jgi:hypothetical protein
MRNGDARLLAVGTPRRSQGTTITAGVIRDIVTDLKCLPEGWLQ